jgi:hypothetical protein
VTWRVSNFALALDESAIQIKVLPAFPKQEFSSYFLRLSLTDIIYSLQGFAVFINWHVIESARATSERGERISRRFAQLDGQNKWENSAFFCQRAFRG